MNDRFVVDTNVLISASASDPNSSLAKDATPPDSEQRALVWSWLDEFQRSTSRMVLDAAGKIDTEYRRKLVPTRD